MPDQISQEARSDYDVLLEFLIPFAQRTLRKNGEFYPFGGAITIDGELTPYGACEGQEMPKSKEVLSMLVSGFQNEARNGKIRTTGVCFDGRIVQENEKVDAIIVDLEHIRGGACRAYVPYKKNFLGKYHFGELSAGGGESKIFVRSEHA